MTGNLPPDQFTPQVDGTGSAPQVAPSPEQQPAPSTEQQPPATEPKTEAPASNEPQTPPSTPEAKLYKLPDGREVDPDTLYKEHVENLLPDYTRKSQRLAELEKGSTPPNINNEQKVPYWEDPNWQPNSYAEILKAADDKRAYEEKLEADRQAQQQSAIKTMVDSQLEEIKKLDPNVDENLVFAHANKYKFPNLISAYQNMVDMNVAVKKTQQQTEKNLRQREADPVSTGLGEPSSDGINYDAIQGRSVQEAAQDHFARIKGN